MCNNVSTSRKNDRGWKQNRGKLFEARQDADSRHGSINKTDSCCFWFHLQLLLSILPQETLLHSYFFSLYHAFFEVRKCRRGLLWNEYNETKHEECMMMMNYAEGKKNQNVCSIMRAWFVDSDEGEEIRRCAVEQSSLKMKKSFKNATKFFVIKFKANIDYLFCIYTILTSVFVSHNKETNWDIKINFDMIQCQKKVSAELFLSSPRVSD